MSITESLFYVANSQIHGKGLFARKYIGAGEIIGVLDGTALVDYVYNAIADYKHVYRINPTVTEVEILLSNRDNVVSVSIFQDTGVDRSAS